MIGFRQLNFIIELFEGMENIYHCTRNEDTSLILRSSPRTTMMRLQTIYNAIAHNISLLWDLLHSCK
jgi:lysyl-tRNA synthetase class II